MSIRPNPNTFAGYYSTYLSSDGQAYGFTTAYGPSASVTLGTYHDLKLTLDFVRRTSTFAVDGTTFGTVAFDPTDTSHVLADVQFTMYSNVSTGPNDPNNPLNAPVNPASYTARIDDLTVTAVPEPTSLALYAIGLGLLGVFGLGGRPTRGLRRRCAGSA